MTDCEYSLKKTKNRQALVVTCFVPTPGGILDSVQSLEISVLQSIPCHLKRCLTGQNVTSTTFIFPGPADSDLPQAL